MINFLSSCTIILALTFAAFFDELKSCLTFLNKKSFFNAKSANAIAIASNKKKLEKAAGLAENKDLLNQILKLIKKRSEEGEYYLWLTYDKSSYSNLILHPQEGFSKDNFKFVSNSLRDLGYRVSSHDDSMSIFW